MAASSKMPAIAGPSAKPVCPIKKKIAMWKAERPGWDSAACSAPTGCRAPLPTVAKTIGKNISQYCRVPAARMTDKVNMKT